jgi:methionyl-tRNA formyltransferase
MKLIVFIGSRSPHLIYFSNKINLEQKIDLLVIENPKPRLQSSSIGVEKKVGLFEKVLRYSLFKIDRKKQKRAELENQKIKEIVFEELFEGLYKELDSSIPTLITEDINSEECKNAVANIGPDLIVDHGTRLVKAEIFELAPIALNVHWGLSPYYRGINSTKRALVNWDLNNIGVTIHKLVKKIDGGDILGQARATIKKSDKHFTIPYRLTVLGTEIVLKGIRKLDRGDDLVFHPQDHRMGFLFGNANWSKDVDQFVDNINESIMEKMLSRPSRAEAPIIEFVE